MNMLNFNIINMALRCNWFAYRTVNPKVTGSSPVRVVIWEDNIDGKCAGLKIQRNRFDPGSSHLWVRSSMVRAHGR